MINSKKDMGEKFLPVLQALVKSIAYTQGITYQKALAKLMEYFDNPYESFEAFQKEFSQWMKVESADIKKFNEAITDHNNNSVSYKLSAEELVQWVQAQESKTKNFLSQCVSINSDGRLSDPANYHNERLFEKNTELQSYREIIYIIFGAVALSSILQYTYDPLNILVEGYSRYPNELVGNIPGIDPTELCDKDALESASHYYFFTKLPIITLILMFIPIYIMGDKKHEKKWRENNQRSEEKKDLEELKEAKQLIDQIQIVFYPYIAISENISEDKYASNNNANEKYVLSALITSQASASNDVNHFILKKKRVKTRGTPSTARSPTFWAAIPKALPFTSDSIPQFLDGQITIDPKSLDCEWGKFFSFERAPEQEIPHYVFIPQDTLMKGHSEFCKKQKLIQKLKENSYMVGPDNKQGYVPIKQANKIKSIPGRIIGLDKRYKESTESNEGFTIKFKVSERYEVFCYELESENPDIPARLIIPCIIADFHDKKFPPHMTANLEDSDLQALRSYEEIHKEMLAMETPSLASSKPSKGKLSAKSTKEESSYDFGHP